MKNHSLALCREKSTVYIDAILDCENHNFLYFSSKEDFSGRHYFAKNLYEHNKNARKYQRVMNKNNLYR